MRDPWYKKNSAKWSKLGLSLEAKGNAYPTKVPDKKEQGDMLHAGVRDRPSLISIYLVRDLYRIDIWKKSD